MNQVNVDLSLCASIPFERMGMVFVWDDEKNKANIKKHGIDFMDVSEVFDYPLLTALDNREDYEEDRWQGIGIIKGRIVVVVFAEGPRDTIRIISARKALKHERTAYEKTFPN